jgi:dipeptidyl aminopeptidase/acylaminoacyl peptidase
MASFDLSASGDLVYQVGQAAGDEVEPLFRIDSAGPVPLEAGSFSGNFSTAWNRNAIIWEQSYFSGESQGRWDLYLHDLDARTTVRLTRDGVNRNPTWSPDDKYVYFTRQDAEGGPRVVRKAVDALGLIESVLPDSFPSSSPSVSPDGSMLLFSGRRPGTRWELRGLRKGTGESFVLSDRLQSAWTPAFSPDGRYAVLQSGQVDTGPILVTAIEGGGQQEVARAGGFPRWSSDGRYIYYARGPRIFRVEVAYEPAFAIVGTEEFVFAAPSDHVHFDLLKDNTLLTSYPPTRVSPGEIRVVLNFNQEMERMAPR